MSVQAAKASSSNRIIIVKDLWRRMGGQEFQKYGIEKNVEKGFDPER